MASVSRLFTTGRQVMDEALTSSSEPSRSILNCAQKDVTRYFIDVTYFWMRGHSSLCIICRFWSSRSKKASDDKTFKFICLSKDLKSFSGVYICEAKWPQHISRLHLFNVFGPSVQSLHLHYTLKFEFTAMPLEASNSVSASQLGAAIFLRSGLTERWRITGVIFQRERSGGRDRPRILRDRLKLYITLLRGCLEVT